MAVYVFLLTSSQSLFPGLETGKVIEENIRFLEEAWNEDFFKVYRILSFWDVLSLFHSLLSASLHPSFSYTWSSKSHIGWKKCLSTTYYGGDNIWEECAALKETFSEYLLFWSHLKMRPCKLLLVSLNVCVLTEVSNQSKVWMQCSCFLLIFAESHWCSFQGLLMDGI